jgi:hypothetical protein
MQRPRCSVGPASGTTAGAPNREYEATSRRNFDLALVDVKDGVCSASL